jgi:hypothetical protein
MVSKVEKIGEEKTKNQTEEMRIGINGGLRNTEARYKLR